MSLDALRQSLPAYARDLDLSLQTLLDETLLTDQQKWGAIVASGHAVGAPGAVQAIEVAAIAAGLSAPALSAAKAAAALMAMNNIYYRALHLMQNAEYRTLPARLRMNIKSNPGVAKTDFELWCLAVSAINGCGACLDAHEQELRTRGVPAPAIQAALRIGAVIGAISHVVQAESALAV